MYSQEFILQLATPELNLGVHSLRLGGTTVAINSDVKEGCWKRLGRWKGDSSKGWLCYLSIGNIKTIRFIIHFFLLRKPLSFLIYLQKISQSTDISCCTIPALIVFHIFVLLSQLCDTDLDFLWALILSRLCDLCLYFHSLFLLFVLHVLLWRLCDLFLLLFLIFLQSSL